MLRFAGLLAISGMLLAFHAVAASADPLKNTDEVAAAILACWKPPADSEGSFVTMRFSFRRDGSIFGHPLRDDGSSTLRSMPSSSVRR